MERGIDLLLIGAGAIIVATIIGLVMLVSRSGSSVAKDANADAMEVARKIVDYDLARYDGETISGAEVKQIIEKYEGKDTLIAVTTLENTEGFSNKQSDGTIKRYAFDAIYDKRSSYYVYDRGLFRVTLGYDENEEFYGFRFDQIE